MKFTFQGNIAELEAGLAVLAPDYGFEIAEGGIPVSVTKGDTLSVDFDGKKASVVYAKKITFFREFAHLVRAVREGKNELRVKETVAFETTGMMVDMSHGSVLNMETFRSMLRKMAMMGMNMLNVYTEESYEIPEYPYFGYLRGRINQAQMKEIDDYADMLGIEIIPAIQALGHLSNTLHWPCFAEIADTYDCLLVGEEKTYDFIRAALKAASAPLRSKRIHIGFDETSSLGTGAYRAKHGYRPRMDIYLEHLNKVAGICKEMGLEPIIWNDMFFRADSAVGYDFCRTSIPPEMAEKIPDNVSLVAYSYGLTEPEKILTRMNGTLCSGKKTYYAGATVDWVGPCVDYATTIKCTPAVMQCAKQVGIKDIYMTTWGDDSPERDYMLDMLGAQIYAEYTYRDNPSLDEIKEAYNFCCISDAQMVLETSALDFLGATPEQENNIFADPDHISAITNPSKYMLYQDPMLGRFDTEVAKADFRGHYAGCAERLKKYLGMPGDWDATVNYYVDLAEVLEDKCDLGVRLINAYKNKDRVTLAVLAEQVIPGLIAKVEKMWNDQQVLWFKRNVSYGCEVLDRRIGTLIMRLRFAANRVHDYLNGKVEGLEELEETRISGVCKDSNTIPFYNEWLSSSTLWGR